MTGQAWEEDEEEEELDVVLEDIRKVGSREEEVFDWTDECGESDVAASHGKTEIYEKCAEPNGKSRK